MKETVKILKAMGDETRIKILILLSQRNICAKGIANRLGISEAAVSQHIKILKEIDLIVGYKRGYHVVYEVNKKVIEKAVLFLNLLKQDDFCSLKDEFDLNADNLNNMQCVSKCKTMGVCCRKNREE